MAFADVPKPSPNDGPDRVSISRDNLSALAETVPVAIGIYRGNHFRFVNRAAEALTGYTAEELVKLDLWDLVHPDYRELLQANARQREQGLPVPSQYEIRLIRRNGEERWVDLTLGPIEYDGEPLMLATAVDISEQRRTLQLQDAVYRIAQAADQAHTLDDLFRSIHATIAGVMPAGNFYISLYDKKADLISFPYFVDEVDPRPAPKKPGRGLTEYVLRTGQPLLCTALVDEELRRCGEIELIGGASAIWLGAPLMVERQTIGVMVVQHYSDPNAYGEPERQMLEFVSSQVAKAIEHKRALDALVESEKRFRALIENSADAVALFSAEGVVLYASPSTTRVLGYAPEELVGQFASKLVHPDDLKNLQARFSGVLDQPGARAEAEMRFQHKNGTCRWTEAVIQNLRSEPSVRALVVNYRDVTERREAEDAVARRARELSGLYETSLEINAQTELTKLLPTIVKRAAALTGAPMGALLLLDATGQKLELAVGHHLSLNQPVMLKLGEGAAGRAALTGQAQIIADYSNWEGRAEAFRDEHYGRMLAMPLKAGSRVIGVINIIDTDQVGQYTDDEIRLVSLFADQAAVAIENARLLQETTRRANELAVLYETVRDLSRQHDLPSLLQSVAASATQLLDAAAGGMYLYDPAAEELEIAVATHPALPVGLRMKVGEGMAGRVAETLEPLILDDYHAWEHRSPQFDRVPVAAVLEVPMLYGGDLVGVLVVEEFHAAEATPEKTGRRFTQEDARLLSLFAGQAAAAVHDARLLEETRSRAERLALLYDAGLALNSVLEPHSQLEFLLRIAMRTLHADRAEFFRLDPALKEMVLELAIGYPADKYEILRHMRFSVEEAHGLQGWVYQHRVPLNLSDLQRDPRYIPVDPEVNSGLLVPVEHEKRIHGTLAMLSTRPGAFSAQDERLLVLFANQAAIALENARLFEETRRRAQQQAVLYSISTKLVQVQGIQEVCDTVIQAAQKSLGYPNVLIYLMDEASGDRVLAARSDSKDSSPPARLHRGQGLSEAAVHTGELQYWWDVTRESGYVPALEGSRSELDIPIQTGGTCLGVMIVEDGRVNAFDSADQEVLTAVANQLAIALDKARLMSELKSGLTLTGQLYELSGRVLAATTFEDTARIIIDSLQERFRPDGAIIYVYDAEGRIELQYGTGFPDRYYEETRPRSDGLAMRVWKSGIPFVVDDPEAMHPNARALGFRGGIVLPLRGESEHLGILFLAYRGPHPFGEREVDLLSLFANQAALALKRVRLLEETRHRADRLALLNRIADAASRSLGLDELLNLIYEQVAATIPADAFFIALYDEVKDELDYRIRIDRGVRASLERRPAKLATLTNYTIINRRPLLVHDWEREKEQYPAPRLWGTMEMPPSVLAVPMMAADKVVGIISVQAYRRNAYDEEAKQLLMTIADQAAIVIRNARLSEETQHRLSELEAVSTISTGVRMAETPEEMLPLLLAEMLRVLQSEAGRIAALDASGQALHVAHARGWFGELPLEVEAAGTPEGQVLASGHSRVLVDCKSELASNEPVPEGWSAAIVPLCAAGERIGVLEVAIPASREFEAHHLRFLEMVADIAGNALRRMRLHESLEASYLETVLALARAVDARDSYSEGHSERLTRYALALAKALCLSEAAQENIRLAACLHDIGKVGVPDEVLLKPGPLSEEEWAEVKRHPVAGAEALQPVRRLAEVVPLVRHHQERYDGQGYPDGLAGEAIPLGARILAIADAFCAMRDQRAYRPARSWNEALAELERCAGTQFDPDLVQRFVQMAPALRDNGERRAESPAAIS